MYNIEPSLIDNSFEDRIIDKIDNNNKTILQKLIHLYKQKNQFKIDCDRSISILEDRIFLNLTYEKIGQKNKVTRTRVHQIYCKILDELKLIAKEIKYNNN